jgi:hypothetical protein
MIFMNKIFIGVFLSVLALLCLIPAGAQVPKGNRILSMQIDVARNGGRDSSLAQARSAGVEAIHLSYPWNRLETAPGVIAGQGLADLRDDNTFYSSRGIRVELNVAPLNGPSVAVPADLDSLPFSHPEMIRRYKILLDSVFACIPDLDLVALNIGNEHDPYVTATAQRTAEYQTFFDSTRAYAKTRYPAMHGRGLAVGTTFTYGGLVGPAATSLRQINQSADVISVNYYGLNWDFTVKAPDASYGDFYWLISQYYPDSTRPIYITECGFPSSPACRSSESLQAAFVESIFTSWDLYAPWIKYLSFFSLTDWPPEVVDYLAPLWGDSNNVQFIGFLGSLGLRRYPGNGSDKPGFTALKTQAASRGWAPPVRNERPEIFPAVSTVTVFPNPFRSTARFQYSGPGVLRSVALYDLRGKQTMLFIKPDKNSIILETGGLPNGLYLLRAATDKNVYFKRLVVQK